MKISSAHCISVVSDLYVRNLIIGRLSIRQSSQHFQCMYWPSIGSESPPTALFPLSAIPSSFMTQLTNCALKFAKYQVQNVISSCVLQGKGLARCVHCAYLWLPPLPLDAWGWECVEVTIHLSLDYLTCHGMTNMGMYIWMIGYWNNWLFVN